MTLSTVRKALAAAAFTAAGTIGGTMLDGQLTLVELVAGVGAGLVAGAATYRIPNAGNGRHKATV